MKPNLNRPNAKKAAQPAPKRSIGAHTDAKKVQAKADAGHAKNLYIAELTRQLKFFTEPDFEAGADFWPRLDRRLYGQIPIIIQQAIDALDAAYQGKRA
jgi:hypothetical protein